MFQARKTRHIINILLFLGLLVPIQVLAEEAAGPAPCAFIQEYTGLIQVLDSTRTKVIDVVKKASIPCEAWISVDEGFVRVRHVQGFNVRIGEGTFVQIHAPSSRSKVSDQFTLYRGSLFAQVLGLEGELRVITANARARISMGRAIVLFSDLEQETQLIGITKRNLLENRYDQRKAIVVGSGEMSGLSLAQMRIVPSTPRAVTSASMRGTLASFSLPASEANEIMYSANKRQERMIAQTPAEDEKAVPADEADAPVVSHASGSYERYPVEQRSPAAIKGASKKKGAASAWKKKLVGGMDDPDSFLFPRPVDSKEKAKLLKELSVQ